MRHRSEQCETTSLFRALFLTQVESYPDGGRDCHWRLKWAYLMLNLYKDQFAVNDNPW